MVNIPDQIIHKIAYPDLINRISSSFAELGDIPQRSHLPYPNREMNTEGILLVMPSWNESLIGVKIITISPENGKLELPAIQGTYTIYNVKDGKPLAMMDAKALTVKRTAATSALASQLLSNPKSKRLLMIGTGALAPELIKAHCTVRTIKNVMIWGRNHDKAKKLADTLSIENVEIHAVESIEKVLPLADIVSVATLSKDPLVQGKCLRPGQHLDMVGAYKSDMRESDDETIKRASIFVDTYKGALAETGELAIPMATGLIGRNDIKAELKELCNRSHSGRKSDSEITFFKSVGHAIEDLTAAGMAFDKFLETDEKNISLH